MALTVCAATFPCPCPPPTPSTKLVVHYCSFTVLTDGTTLHCVLLSLQCFRHFEKVKDAFTHFPARFRDSTVAEQEFVSLAYAAAHFNLSLTLRPSSASQTPALPHFLKTSPLSLTLPPSSASQTPALPHFLKTSSLSRLPWRPLQPPKPQRFPLRLSLAYPAAHFRLPNPSALPHFLHNPLQFAPHIWSLQLRGGVPGHRQRRRSFSQAHDIAHDPVDG
jgi:hypothetical protein